jgi:hypothetical protein
VRINDTKIRFLTADVAIEDGTIEIGPAGAVLTGRFSATWVRHDGTWKLAALREARAAEPSGPARLEQLAWSATGRSSERLRLRTRRRWWMQPHVPRCDWP